MLFHGKPSIFQTQLEPQPGLIVPPLSQDDYIWAFPNDPIDNGSHPATAAMANIQRNCEQVVLNQ
jgi:hypothetical protein